MALPDATYTEKFTIEVRDKDGDLVSILDNAFGGRTERAVNSPAVLTFKLPADDDKADGINFSSELWVRKPDGTIEEKFLLSKGTKKTQRNDKGIYNSFEAYSYLAQLTSKIEDVYDTGASGDTISNIVAEILAYQVGENQITVGTIDAAIGDLTRAVNVERDTIIRALAHIAGTLDFENFIKINPENRELNWTTSIGEDKGQQIRDKKNLKSLVKEEDFSNLATKIYARGRGEGDAALTLPAPGYVGAGFITYNYRKKIKTDHTKVVGTGETDIEVLIYLASDSDLVAHARADGFDISFFDMSGNELAHDRVKYDNATGELEAHVSLPTLSAAVDIEIWMYYGDAAASDQNDPENTWDSDFKAVLHLLDLTTSTVEDSTSNDNDGAKKAASEPIEATGKVGQAQSFDGIDDYIKITDGASLRFGSDGFALQGWIKAPAVQDLLLSEIGFDTISNLDWKMSDPIIYRSILDKKTDGRYMLRNWQDQLTFEIEDHLGNNVEASSSETVFDNAWHYIALIVDRTGNQAHLLVDEVWTTTDISSVTGNISPTDDLYIGVDGNEEYPFQMILDELWASGTAREKNRILTQRANQNSPTTFIIVGIEQKAPGGISDTIIDKRITHLITLQAWANAELQKRQVPKVTYRPDSVDLSQISDDFDFEKIQLGSVLWLIDEELGVAVNIRILKIVRNLDNPSDVKLDMSNLSDNLSDNLSEIYDIQQLGQHAAVTRVSAGEVVISGVVTIKDWVSEGETTIDGGHITAETITTLGTITTAVLNADHILGGTLSVDRFGDNTIDAVKLVLGSWKSISEADSVWYLKAGTFVEVFRGGTSGESEEKDTFTYTKVAGHTQIIVSFSAYMRTDDYCYASIALSTGSVGNETYYYQHDIDASDSYSSDEQVSIDVSGWSVGDHELTFTVFVEIFLSGVGRDAEARVYEVYAKKQVVSTNFAT